MAGEDQIHDENANIPPPVPPTQQTPHTLSTIKLPILKKGEYDIWAMKMEHYLGHTDYPIWEVIQKGNGPVQVSTDTNGQIRVLPPKTAEEILARERERKARTTLLMSIPEDHLAKFHKMTDAKEMWEAIKSRFGGNDESKKMQKYILKQQFESFSVSNSEGLHKGYDRFQSLLSQLEIHGAGVSTEDANQKFLRSLPASWSQVSLIMRTKPGVDSLSFDDLYNNLRVFEPDVKGSTGSSSSAQNVAFVSSSTSSTNNVSTAYGGSTSSSHNSQKEGSSSYTDELMMIEEFLREDMEKLQFDAKEPVSFHKTKEEPKALITLDGDGVDWTGHAEDEQENFALMAYSNSGSDMSWETVKEQNTCSPSPKADKRDWNGLMSKKLGLGYGFTRKACFVYGSFDHLIRDCDFHEKRMAKQDDPQKALKNKGIVDSGCYRHMTGNKAYLVEYQDYYGGPVAFGGSKGQITSKGKIITGKIDFEDVYFFPDENQVLLRVPRQNNMYSFNLENIVPTGGLACLIAKATVDESNKWHRRLGTQDNIDARNSEMEAEPAQEYFVLPLLSSYTSTVKSSEANNEDEKPNGDSAEAFRKEFAQYTKDLLLQARAARATSTNTVNIVSTPIITASPSRVFSAGGPDLTNNDQDDSQIPVLEEIYINPSNGIFTNASYDDKGAVADFTNLETTVNVSPIFTSRIHSIHLTTQILRDLTSAVQTRSKVNKSSGAYAFIEPKKISQDLEDKSWVDVMQEELLQFKIQKVWIPVDLPFGKKAIGTK
ncbi:hypothetical protein Tco_0534540 [Tanacetum coccineum]